MPPPPPDVPLLTGHLWVFVAFDWGDELDFTRARQFAPGAALELSRRPRTPSSFAYKPRPLRFPLEARPLPVPGLEGTSARVAEATVFDFAAVSVAFQVPFHFAPAALAELAGRLAEPATVAILTQTARAVLMPLYNTLLPAIDKPSWDESMSEEFFVFQLPAGPGLPTEKLLAEQAPWVAGLVRLEDVPLSDEEIAEAVKYYLRYGRDDLFVADWAAAVVVDEERECAETLQTIEFANLQLLEYRHIDDRLDRSQSEVLKMLGEASKWRRPFLSGHDRPVRRVGELKVEASNLFERTGNVLKLVGDQYLARLYNLLATRFHLREWERSIRGKLEVIEGVYQVLSDQVQTFRGEFLEILVVILILIEILLAIFMRH
jgi:hypothetical protein